MIINYDDEMKNHHFCFDKIKQKQTIILLGLVIFVKCVQIKTKNMVKKSLTIEHRTVYNYVEKSKVNVRELK